MPSRLEGIETVCIQGEVCIDVPVRVYMCLPVWRELKPIYSRYSIRLPKFVYMCLPVWRELKLWERVRDIRRIQVYMCLPVWRELKLNFITQMFVDVSVRRLHVPSRLEGIETLLSTFIRGDP